MYLFRVFFITFWVFRFPLIFLVQGVCLIPPLALLHAWKTFAVALGKVTARDETQL